MEGEASHQRQDHLEVERERPDQRHRRQRNAQLGRLGHVAQRRTKLAGLASRGFAGIQEPWVDHPQRNEHCAEGERVDEEAGRHSDRGDHATRDRRPDDPGGVHDQAVQADGVDDAVTPDHLHHKALTGWVVDRVDRPAGEDEREHHPRLDPARRGQRPQGECGHGHERLRDRQQPSLGHPVRQQPAPGAGEQHRDELKGGRQPEREAAVRQAQHEPHLGDDLHPVAAERDHLADEVAAVVRDRQRAERQPQARGAHRRRPSSSSIRRSISSAARSRTSSCSGSRRWSRRAR